VNLATVLVGAARSPGLRTIIDIDDVSLISPGTPTDPMRQRVVQLARRAREPVPEERDALTRCTMRALVRRPTVRRHEPRTGIDWGAAESRLRLQDHGST